MGNTGMDMDALRAAALFESLFGSIAGGLSSADPCIRIDGSVTGAHRRARGASALFREELFATSTTRAGSGQGPGVAATAQVEAIAQRFAAKERALTQERDELRRALSCERSARQR